MWQRMQPVSVKLQNADVQFDPRSRHTVGRHAFQELMSSVPSNQTAEV